MKQRRIKEFQPLTKKCPLNLTGTFAMLTKSICSDKIQTNSRLIIVRILGSLMI